MLQRTRGRGDETKLLVLTADRGVVRLGPTDFAGPVRAIGAIELPRPFAPRSPAFRRAVVEALRAVRVRERERRRGPRRRRGSGDAAGDGNEAGRHPVARCPDLGTHLRYAERAERLARDVDRLERRIRGRTESLARQFDRVLRVLDSWGYVDGWQLTEAGEMLTRLYSETDLLLAESLREGLLDGLDAPSMAAVCSVFSYETARPRPGRGPAGAVPEPHGARPGDRDRPDLAGSQRRGGRSRPARDPPARRRVRRRGPRLGQGVGPGGRAA